MVELAGVERAPLLGEDPPGQVADGDRDVAVAEVDAGHEAGGSGRAGPTEPRRPLPGSVSTRPGGGQLADDVGDRGRGQPGQPGQLGLGGRRRPPARSRRRAEHPLLVGRPQRRRRARGARRAGRRGHGGTVQPGRRIGQEMSTKRAMSPIAIHILCSSLDDKSVTPDTRSRHTRSSQRPLHEPRRSTVSTPLHRVAAAGRRAAPRPCGAHRLRRQRRRERRRQRRRAAAPPSRCCCPSPRPPATRPSTSRSSRPRSPSCATTARSYYYNADQDEAKQAQQVDTAINEGADVIVLDPVNGAGAGGMVTVRPGRGRPGHRLRPVHRGGRLLHVLRQRDGRQDAGRGAGRGDGRQGQHPDAQRRPERPERRAVQGRRAQRPRRAAASRSSRSTTTPTGARRTPRSSSPTSSASTTPSEIQGVYAANDGQAGGVVAALTGARRRRGRPAADHRPGRRARRHPADPRRRAGDDDLQADPDRGRDRRRGRGQARQRRGGQRHQRHRHRADRLRGRHVVHLRPDRRHRRQRRRHGRRRRFYTVDDICTDEYADACEAAGIC